MRYEDIFMNSEVFIGLMIPFLGSALGSGCVFFICCRCLLVSHACIIPHVARKKYAWYNLTCSKLRQKTEIPGRETAGDTTETAGERERT